MKIKRYLILFIAAFIIPAAVVHAESTGDNTSIVGDDIASLNSPEMKNLKKFIETARGHIGDKYNRIGSNPEMGFNDVTFIRYVLHETNLRGDVIPNRVSMYAACGSIQKSDDSILPGSLVFFGKNVNNIEHIGIMVTPTSMIHVGEKGVEETEIKDGWEGHIFAYGQVVYLEKTQFEYPGRYDEDPRLDPRTDPND